MFDLSPTVFMIGALFLLFRTSSSFSSPVKYDTSSKTSMKAPLKPGHLSQDKNIAAGNGKQDVWLIAHKVLTQEGFDAALKHGANAIEIDCMAWSNGWYADHDGTVESRHDDLHTLTQYIADKDPQRQISFIWFDIKNPDFCDLDNRVCSIRVLQQMARGILRIQGGMQILYGFLTYEWVGSGKTRRQVKVWEQRAGPLIRDSLNANEAINYDGSVEYTPSEANEMYLRNVQRGHKVASYSRGYAKLKNHFGDCVINNRDTCNQLKLAHESGEWAKVFGWTVTKGMTTEVDALLGIAWVDGMIIGDANDIYADEERFVEAMNDVKMWVSEHKETHRLADAKSPPPFSDSIADASLDSPLPLVA